MPKPKMLKQLKQLLQDAGQMPLRELAHALNLDQQSTKQLLMFYTSKGQVEKLPEGTVCDHCTVCKPESIEIYKWVEKNSIPLKSL